MNNILHTDDMSQNDVQKTIDIFSYVVNSGEQIRWVGQIYRPVIYLGAVSQFILFFIILVMMGIAGVEILHILVAFVILFAIILITTFNALRKKYAITDGRVLFKTGIIGRGYRSYPFTQIKSKSVSVGLIGLIFKTGSVFIDVGEIEYVDDDDYDYDNNRRSGSLITIMGYPVGGGRGRRGRRGRSRTKFHTFRHIRDPYNATKLIEK